MNAPAPARTAEEASSGPPLVALIGNPNTGKTTLFNELTGARARVGNYPGITVERRVGPMRLGDREAELVDLPGSYSLSARSREEQIAIEAVVGLAGNPRPALCVVVVDAGQLVRNLYLALQLIELQVPMVVAINMVDEVDDPVDAGALSELLGVPCVAISAKVGTGLDALREAVAEGLDEAPTGTAKVDYPAELQAHVDAVAAAVPEAWLEDAKDPEARRAALALWALSSVDEDDELRDVPEPLRRAALDAAEAYDVDLAIVTARYTLLDAQVGPLLRVDATPAVRWTDRVDRVLLHPVGGFVVFIAIMIVVFQSLFSWADPAIGVVESLFGWLGGLAQTHLPEGFVADLVSQGIISGVGNVVVFLPQIILLFLLLGFLEDSGYMARAAYLMDRIMRSLGLHGRAFVPMLSGCACAIPAIMATRTMERQRDRLLTMLVIPLMTCSARLPVYTLVIAALFPPGTVLGFIPVQGLLMVGMYLFSTTVTLIAAGVLGRTVVKGRRMPLLLELPPYRLPTVKSVVRQTADRALTFLKEAGTVILGFTIILWLALSYPKPDAPPPEPAPTVQLDVSPDGEAPEVGADADAEAAARALEASAGGQLGRALEPVVRPLGFDWKLTVAIIGAFSAREVFVSTLGLIYGIGADADEESAPLRTQLQNAKRPNGEPVYTPLVGLSLMVFFALACQCMSTLAVVKRETQSWKWPSFLFVYMTALAYVASFLVYQGGKLLGFA